VFRRGHGGGTFLSLSFHRAGDDAQKGGRNVAPHEEEATCPRRRALQNEA
jgi:hypothetical protein